MMVFLAHSQMTLMLVREPYLENRWPGPLYRMNDCSLPSTLCQSPPVTPPPLAGALLRGAHRKGCLQGRFPNLTDPKAEHPHPHPGLCTELSGPRPAAGRWGWGVLGFLWSELTSPRLRVPVCPALQREVLRVPGRGHQEHHQQVRLCRSQLPVGPTQVQLRQPRPGEPQAPRWRWESWKESREDTSRCLMMPAGQLAGALQLHQLANGS